MVLYRRNYLPGGTFFFTVTLRNRRLRLLTEHLDMLREAFREVKADRPFEIDAIVILPEHLHLIWTLPEGDADYSTRWRLIKGGFTRRLKARGVNFVRDARGEHGLWARRFWEHTIRDETDLQQHIDYIHFNPVKHSHVSRPIDWPHSSLRRYVRKGILSNNWGSSGIDLPDSIGHE
ncbi:MAG: transposase [Pseudomonadota bacterium]